MACKGTEIALFDSPTSCVKVGFTMMFLKKFSGCLREVTKVFQGCFKVVLRVFQGRLRVDSREVQGYQK